MKKKTEGAAICDDEDRIRRNTRELILRWFVEEQMDMRERKRGARRSEMGIRREQEERAKEVKFTRK